MSPPDADARWSAVLRKLEARRRRGAVVQKRVGGVRVWVVRFREEADGRAVQRTVYLGVDPSVADRARAWLAHLRAEGNWRERLDAAARLAARVGVLVRRRAGGGVAARRRRRCRR